MMKQGIRLGLIAAALSALAGCASTPKTAEVQLPDPKNVPHEKWSDAMVVLTAMGIEGQRDIPKELAGQVPSTVVHGSGAGGGVGDLAIGGAGFASPPTGFSNAGALGMGVGMFLLGGGGAQPVGIEQIAAWVPADLAASPQEAVQLVRAEWEKARKVFEKQGISKVKTATAKYPDGTHFKKAYASMGDSYLRMPLQYDLPSSQAPKFINSSSAYGPIFILGDQLPVDSRKNNMEEQEYMAYIAKQLPDWFYLYYPGLKERKRIIPAAIYNKGKTMFFVGK